MTKLGTKLPNWVRNDQIENKSGYELTKMVQNDLGTKLPGNEMTDYLFPYKHDKSIRKQILPAVKKVKVNQR